jgi:chemotaxis protein methyltransferase WspC
MRLPSDRNLVKLEAAVRRRVGFDPKSIGDQSLLRAVSHRMTELQVTDGNDYVTGLLKEDSEFDSLVEELLVPETWFFRDRQPFRCVQHYVAECWRPTRLGDRLRILSIPCSTGEEPYSIAMTLLDAGLLSSQFHIDGVDLSRRSLRQAEEAVFRKSSFRGDEAAFPGVCDGFLERRDDRYVASGELRGAVRFAQANLVSPSLLENQPSYHMVFCRNVLIYLDEDARRTALTNLHRLLLPEGLLYVGHVEARVAAEGPFGRFGDRFPFAFSPTIGTPGPATTRRARAVVSPVRLPGVGGTLGVTARKPSLSSGVTSRTAGRTPRLAKAKQVERAATVPDVATTLAAARLAANAGRLDEACKLCDEILQREPTCVNAVYLLGIVSEARGDKGEAERFYQKALYLDPRHRESLVHMMLAAQERGDDNSAANFRRRLDQIQDVGG